jgi:hypothetical protein
MSRSRLLIALFMVGATIAAPYLPGPWASARWIALCVAPGLAGTLLLQRRLFERPARAIVAVLLSSAVLAPASSFALMQLYGSLDAALLPFSLLWGLLLATALLLPYHHGLEGRGDTPPRARNVAAWVVLVAGVVALPLLLNADLRVRSDAWTHIALTRKILAGPHPWTDPRFAGEPLRYFWFLDLWSAGFAARQGTSIAWGLTLITVTQLVAWVAAVWNAAESLFPRGALRRAVVAVAAFGLNPLGVIGIVTHPLQGLIGATRSEAAVHMGTQRLRFFDADVIYTLTPHGTLFVAWIDKFLVATAFGIGMTAALLLMTTLWEAARKGRMRADALYLVAAGFAAVLLHHLVAAAFVGVTFAAALVVPRMLGRSALTWRDTFVTLALLAAIGLAAAPYAASILAGRAGPGGFGVGVQRVWVLTTVTALGPLLALLWLGRRALAQHLGSAAPHALAFIVTSLGLMLLVTMPSVNENKMLILFFCAAAPLGAPGLLVARAWLWKRPGTRVAGNVLAVAVILVPALIWTGYLVHRDPRVPADVTAACTWLREQTPADAVLIEPEGRRFLMNRAARDMLASDRTFIRECGYPPVRLLERLTLIEHLYQTGNLTGPERALLESHARPVYAFYIRAAWGGADDHGAPEPAARDFVCVFQTPGAAVYQFRPGAMDDAQE